MSDDFDRDDDRVRPSRESPMRPARSDNPPSRRRDDYDDDDDRPRRRASGGEGGVKTVLIVLACIGVVGFCLIAAVVGGVFMLVRTATKQISAFAAQMQADNYKEVAVAVHSYHDKYGTYPPVAMKTKDGKGTGLSWRVAILEFMGPQEQALYRRFKLDEPWDSDNNRRLAAEMPYVFVAPNAGYGEKTHMRVFTGNRAMFDLNKPKRIVDITDGLANTIMIVEAMDAVVWTKPDELPFDPKKMLPTLGLPGNDHFHAAMGDGSVRTIRKSINPEKLKLAIDSQDGQPIDLDN